MYTHYGLQGTQESKRSPDTLQEPRIQIPVFPGGSLQHPVSSVTAQAFHGCSLKCPEATRGSGRASCHSWDGAGGRRGLLHSPGEWLTPGDMGPVL